MSDKRKVRVHYRGNAPRDEVYEVNRVAPYCGAITHHSSYPNYVKEISDVKKVTCKNCLRRVSKEVHGES